MILGEQGMFLLITERDAYILADAVRTWRKGHEHYGAWQKLAPILPLLEEWERVADAHRQKLLARASTSAVGRTQRSPAPKPLQLMSEPISTVEAGRRLDVSDRQVRRLIEARQLDATTVGRTKQVDPESVEQLRQLRQRTGT